MKPIPVEAVLFDLHGTLAVPARRKRRKTDIAAAPAAYRPVAGAADVVRSLAADCRVVVVSDGRPDRVAAALDAIGLLKTIGRDAIVTPADAGFHKPDPRLFAAACRTAGVPPDRAVMVGDSWARDVAGALRAGLHAVWYRPSGCRARRAPSPRPFRTPGRPRVVVIRSLDELPALLVPTGRRQA